MSNNQILEWYRINPLYQYTDLNPGKNCLNECPDNSGTGSNSCYSGSSYICQSCGPNCFGTYCRPPGWPGLPNPTVSSCPGWSCKYIGQTCSADNGYTCCNQTNNNCDNPPCWFENSNLPEDKCNDTISCSGTADIPSICDYNSGACVAKYDGSADEHDLCTSNKQCKSGFYCSCAMKKNSEDCISPYYGTCQKKAPLGGLCAGPNNNGSDLVCLSGNCSSGKCVWPNKNYYCVPSSGTGKSSKTTRAYDGDFCLENDDCESSCCSPWNWTEGCGGNCVDKGKGFSCIKFF